MPCSNDQWTIVVDYHKIEELAKFQLTSVNLNELATSQKLAFWKIYLSRYFQNFQASQHSIFVLRTFAERVNLTKILFLFNFLWGSRVICSLDQHWQPPAD